MYQLHKNEIITKYSNFKYLINKGIRLYKYPIKLIFIFVDYKHNIKYEKCSVKIAFSVPKKNIKKSVDRNYIKRILKESYRQNKHLININKYNIYILLVYLSKQVESFQNVFMSVKFLIKKINTCCVK